MAFWNFWKKETKAETVYHAREGVKQAVRVFSPSGSGKTLLSGKEQIFPTEDFFIAHNSHLLSRYAIIRNGFPGPNFYPALRLEKPLAVSGVRVKTSNNLSGPISTSPVILPAGSLLVRTFKANSKGEHIWTGITPRQESEMVLQRIEFDRKEGGLKPSVHRSYVHPKGSMSCSSLNNKYILDMCVNSWKHAAQRDAHLRDIELVDSLGLVAQDFFGCKEEANLRLFPQLQELAA